ncbi:MAG: bifunctional isocitrate dehydrogenase kinase/phosphatase [Chloroflexi bacterium]|nr:bifunctional isocitrate dehydrogenase kinase/phosphatase [Chloroflexota bacterium]
MRRWPLAQRGSKIIYDGFDEYRRKFAAITRRAQSRFESQDWQGVQRDMRERLEARAKVVDQVVAHLQAALKNKAKNKALWSAMKGRYSSLAAERGDAMLAKTFFNSVTRRILVTVGIDARIEYVAAELSPPPARQRALIYRRFACHNSTKDLIKRILLSYRFKIPYQNVDRDAALAAEDVDRALPPEWEWGAHKTDRVEMLKPVFYRNKGAYLIGRICREGHCIPLVLPLLNNGQGIVVDAALLTQNEASIVFSFTRSYFHVEAKHPHELIEFLKSIMPNKRVAELYISIGEHKHGKTELYRDLMRHLDHSDDLFELAPGDRGMVMTVFTLPSYDIVFKIIRDKFAYPKTTTRREVMEKYQLVFNHDRAGRLVDAQGFEHLQFDKKRFSAELLAELLETAPGSVSVNGDRVTIKHLYTERRLTPLNLYIRAADPVAAHDAVVDYGQAIKDLAATNVFPGDLLLKNFGVTRHGRVVFYDYDELCLVTDCNFREMPRASTAEEEFDGEPWFYVGPNDIFPEEILTFLGFPGDLRALFTETHGDLLGVDFWIKLQQRHRAGEVIDIFPYKQSKRLTHRQRSRVL